MSFILVPQCGERIQINAWSWRPMLEVLRAENLVEDQETLERMSCNGCGATIDEELARRIAAAIGRRLAEMHPGERLLGDLSVTNEPRKTVVFGGEAPTDDIDTLDMYTADYDWLVTFRDFCERSGGFKVV